MDSYLHKLQPPGGMQRKAEYDQLRDRQVKCGNGDQAMLACLDHHPGQGPGGSTLFPTLLTHNSVWSWKRRRLATGSECLAAQGLDMHPELAGQRGVTPLRQIFDTLSDGQQRALAGNAMHLPLFTLWTVYVLGHTRRVNDNFLSPARCMPNQSPDMLGTDATMRGMQSMAAALDVVQPTAAENMKVQLSETAEVEKMMDAETASVENTKVQLSETTELEKKASISSKRARRFVMKKPSAGC
eukprot:3090040-Amphidinium_carterae.1